jgi:5-methylcytosine-specific restriction endonuclease McrA
VKYGFDKAQWQRASRAKAKAQGRCSTCGRSVEKIRCEACKESNRRSYRKHRFHKLAQVSSRRPCNRYGSFTEREWLAIIERQRHRCAMCGLKAKLTIDHIIPLSRGGSDYAVNIQGLCQPCNAGKRDKIAIGQQYSIFDIA